MCERTRCAASVFARVRACVFECVSVGAPENEYYRKRNGINCKYGQDSFLFARCVGFQLEATRSSWSVDFVLLLGGQGQRRPWLGLFSDCKCHNAPGMVLPCVQNHSRTCVILFMQSSYLICPAARVKTLDMVMVEWTC